ncbi:hypothetical protein HYW36_01995 [Candidatus Saccharibacteria bacterium]|nr:hypothetical protein [Candidatus Saccharibacteria bacterium]
MSTQEQTTSESHPQSQATRQFNEALVAIHAHNDEYSLGKAMAHSIFGIIGPNLRIGKLMESGMTELEARRIVAEEGPETVPHSEEQEMARGILDLTSAQTLQPIGLKITPVRQQAVMFGPQGKEEIGPVRLQLEDGDKFGSFLSGIGQEQVDDDFRKNVAFTVGSILVELSDAIASGQDKDFVLETFTAADELIKGLEDIGLGESEVAKKLRDYAEHAKTGDLTEFVLAERIQLFVEPGTPTFGPSQWQRDATPKFLQDRWDEVVALLRKAKANPRAEALFNQLMENAKANLDYARKDWTELKGKYGKDYGKGFDGVFNEVDVRLQGLS